MNDPKLNSTNYNEVDLGKLFITLWKKKFFFILTTSLAAFLSLIFAFNQPNIYISKGLLVPANPQDSLSSKISGLSSFAGLGGFSLPDVPASQSKEAIERIKSFEFFKNYFLPNIKLIDLMAVDEWIPSSNTLSYDQDIYDYKLDRWKSNSWIFGSHEKESEPSAQKAYKVYKKIISINQDEKTSFVTISIEHKSPIVAKNWANLIINQINESMREFDKDQAQKSISYLNEVSKTTNIQSIKEVISLLLEEQMQILMLTSSSEFYVFKIIDSPIAPELKSKPNRGLILLLGIFLGILISTMYIIIQNFKQNT